MPESPPATDQPQQFDQPTFGHVRPARPWLELTVVLLIGVFPHLTNALVPILFDPTIFDGSASMAFATESIMHIASSIGLIAVLLWIMRQSGEPWAFFGLCKPKPGKDFISGVGLYSLDWIVYMGVGTAIATVLWNLGIDTYDSNSFETGMLARPTHPLDLPMIVVMSVANASAEQLVITAYLISRLRSLLKSAPAALVLSTALFASYHAYQGTWGVINAVGFGLVFGGYFCLTKRIWPCIVAHCFGDIVPYVLAYMES